VKARYTPAPCAGRARKVHPKCRPPSVHPEGGILRLRDDGRFVRDNGDAGLAFIGLAPEDDGGAVIWVANCTCKVYLDCPVSKALAFAAHRYSSATVVRRRKSTLKLDRVRRVRKKRKR